MQVSEGESRVNN